MVLPITESSIISVIKILCEHYKGHLILLLDDGLISCILHSCFFFGHIINLLINYYLFFHFYGYFF